MSDVLLSNALETQYKLEKDIKDLDPSVSVHPTDKAGIPGEAVGGDWDSDISNFTNSWNLIPAMDSPTGSLCVMDYDSAYWRCDRSCNWSVPSGVTEAKFQLWGPGSGTGANCCCGGAPYGPTGAYMTFTKTVSSGQVYCIHTGCAYCCCASMTTPGVCGSPTCLNGPGLTGVCVDSGCSCWGRWWSDLGWPLWSNDCDAPTLDGCSVNSCSGWNYCWDTGNDNTEIPFAYSSSTGHGTFDSSVSAETVHIINGMWPYLKIGQDNHQVCNITAPVYGFVNKMTGCRPTTYSSGQGHCLSANQGYHQYPGQGGAFSYACGGSGATSYTGDYGRAGMVCIQWK